MQIKIHKNFKKRLNSTKRPTGGTMVDVVLKEECTVENPIFLLNGYDASIDYIEAFGKYYFVDKKTLLDNNICEYSCIEDYLATAKTDIGNTSALIARSSSNFNKYIRDDMVTVTNQNVTSVLPADASMPFDDTGCFIISVVNNVSSETAYVANYILNPGLMTTLAEWLSGQGNYTTAGDTWDNIQSFLIIQFGDVFDCMRACKWIPIPYDTAKNKGTLDTIHIGKYDSGIPAYWVTSTALLTDSAASIQFNQTMLDDFRSSTPFSSVDIFIPYYGMISVDPAQCYYGKIHFEYYIDLTTGDCYVRGLNMYDKLVFSISFDIGVDTPIAQVGRTGGALAQSILSTVGAVAAGNPLSMISGGIGIVSALASNGVSQKGTLSGRAMSQNNTITAYVTIMVTTSIDAHTALYGRPLMEVKQINTLSGYVQCINASISSALTQSEIAKVNGMLNEGFYYE